MRYRRLGQTDLEISILGFGASPLGNVFSTVDPIECERAVHHAIESGINFFDVSPYYGSTLAEQRLGAALRGRRGRIILATKCGRYGASDFDFSASAIAASLDASLKRLQTDYVDLLQVHDVEFGSFEQICEETVPALRAMQQAGKARYIGVTGYSLKMLAEFSESTPIDSVLSYCRYNLMVRDMDQRLTPIVQDRGIGLINASPLHMGILSSQPLPDWHPAPTRVREAARRVAAVCEAHGRSMPEVALRFCLDHPYVSSTLVGMASVTQVEQNLPSVDAAYDPALVEEITLAIGPELNFVWPSGRAENHD